MEKLGGLIKKMPQTAALFLVGAISISAIPPFNGFASEYQIYQSLLNISHLNLSGFWNATGVLAGAALALTGALAAACFVKAFGITFLGLPRSIKVAQAKEVPWRMRLSMGTLGFLCLILGVTPGIVLNKLSKISAQLHPGSPLLEIRTFNLNLAFLLIIILFVLFGLNRLLTRKKVRKSETWGCGIVLNSSMEYTAASFSQPIRRVYRFLLQPQRKIKHEYKQHPYFGYRIRFQEPIRSVIRDYLYIPLRKITVEASKKWRFIQSGSINLYLGYIFITLILLLLWAR